MHRTFIVMSPRWKGWPVRAFAVMRPLLWVCREQLAQGGKRTRRNEFETHQVFAAKRQRLQHLLGHRGIGDLSDLRRKLRPTEPAQLPGRRARPAARSASIPARVARSALRLEVRLDEPQPLVDAARHL